MIDQDKEFKIGEDVIKEKGSLLSLTATEAMKQYGSPPVPLLGAGISENLDDLLDGIHGAGNWTASQLQITWSEKLASFLNSVTPLLMGAGLLLLFIEFKTPGFGLFGISGGVLLAIVFAAQFTAGLSGHEPALFFALGVLLVLVELFFFPGSIAFAVAGVALMLGSLVWSMADLWPDQPVSFTAEIFLRPLANVTVGVSLAIVLFFVMLRYLPNGGPWGGMILEAAVKGEPVPKFGGVTLESPLVGRPAIAVTSLFPSGQVEVDGRRYEAKLAVGFAEAGTPLVIKRQGEFSLEVEVAS